MNSIRRHRVPWLCVFWGSIATLCVAVFAPAAGAEPCACGDPEDDEGYGIIYSDTDVPSFREIAEMLAPILWFSPDEPLLQQEKPFPSAHPCDVPADGPVVYYQVSEVVLRGQEPVVEPIESDTRFFEKVRLMSLNMFFYYPRDIGMGGHEHDIEGAIFEVALERQGNGCNVVRLLLVKASAHGQPWYANRLKPASGTRYPITLLVEEGKHASCTDRNSDGRYTPGYDVNQFVNDGWGVRDVFGAGFLFTGNYAAYMTKTRLPDTRVLPSVDGPPPCVHPDMTALTNVDEALGRYELRPGAGLGLCDEMGTGRDSSFLHVMMRVNGLGQETDMLQHGSEFDRRFVKTASGAPNLARRIAVRYDEREFGITFSVFGIDLGEGWLVGRLHLISGVSTELMFTRSASRWSDGYFLGGWEWKDSYYRTVDGEQVLETPYRSQAVWETGVRVRVGLPEGWIRWIFLNQRFAGIRTGVRFNGVDRLQNARWTIEFGSGVW